MITCLEGASSLAGPVLATGADSTANGPPAIVGQPFALLCAVPLPKRYWPPPRSAARFTERPETCPTTWIGGRPPPAKLPLSAPDVSIWNVRLPKSSRPSPIPSPVLALNDPLQLTLASLVAAPPHAVSPNTSMIRTTRANLPRIAFASFSATSTSDRVATERVIVDVTVCVCEAAAG
jgi:hypothetical protein